MRSMDFETALQLWDGLCREMGATAEERARILQFDDDMLAWLFDIYRMLHGLFRNNAVVQKFIREPQRDLLTDGCNVPRTVAQVAFGGSRNNLILAREYVSQLAGLR